MPTIPPNSQISQITVNETGQTRQMTVIVSSYSSVSEVGGPQALYLTQDPNAPDTMLTIGAGQDLLVYADTIYIAGPLTMPSCNVVLVARQFGSVADTGGNPGKIIVDGTAGGAPSPAPLQPGQADSGSNGSGHGSGAPGDTGTVGTPGDQGAPGGNAGSITIVAYSLLQDAPSLSAAGGQGGTGQDGGMGGDGGDGGSGELWYIYSPPQGENKNYCSNGGAAGDGGDGGSAGAGGSGGNGGTITVQCTAAQPSGTTMSAPAGTLGQAGTAGTGGNPGSPGHSGAIGGGTSCSNGASGIEGDPGGVLTATNNAIAGTAQWNVIATSAFADAASSVLPSNIDIGAVWPALCQLQMQEAKALYLAADPTANPNGFTNAAAILSWLVTVTQEYTATPPPTPPGLAAGDVTTLATINLQASALVQRLVQGLDYYGNPFNYVPLVSYTALSNILSSLTTDYGTVQSQANAYFAALADQQTMLAQLQSSLAQASSSASQLQAQQEDVQAQLEALPATIDSQSQAVQAQQAQVNTDLVNVAGQIEQAAGSGCTMTNIFSALTMLAQAPDSALGKLATVVGVIGGSVSQAAQGNLVGPDGPVQSQYLIQLIGVYGSGVTSIAEGYSQLNGYITSDDPNGAKLMIAVEQLEAQLAPYMSIIPAQFTADLNQYLSLVQTMNNSIVNYNTLLAQYTQWTAQLAANTQQQNTLKSAIGTNTNLALPALTSYMSTLYSDLRDLCIYQLYLATRAFAFWALQDPQSLYTLLGCNAPVDMQASILTGASATVLGNYYTAMGSFGKSAQTFPAGDARGLMFALPAEAITALQNGQDAFVTIPPCTPSQQTPPFQEMCNIRITTARPWVIGVTTSNNDLVLVNITHPGPETLVDANGNTYSYVHAPVNTLFEYFYNLPQTSPQAIEEDANLGNSEPGTNSPYAAVGPFTTWRISIDPSANPGLDTSQISAVNIEFFGQNLTFSDAPLRTP